MKRGNTMAENTQDDVNNMGSLDEITANGAQEDNQSLSHQKSLKSQKGAPIRGESEDDAQVIKYNYRAIGGDRRVIFQATLTEMWLENLNACGGYFLRMEASTGASTSAAIGQVQKRLVQQAFQFSYDPIFKRFTRELRDDENKDFLVDRYFVDLKMRKEQIKQEATPDPTQLRYANMSYINFLNRHQRMIEKGVSLDDFDDEEEDQSEDESNASDEKSRTGKAATAKDDTKTKQSMM